MRTKTVLIGAGGFGREALDVVEAYNDALDQVSGEKIEIYGVIDDAPSEINLSRIQDRGYQYLGTVDDFIADNEAGNFVLGIGNPKVRVAVAERMESAGWKAVGVVHPTATIGSRGQLGDGSIVCAGAQISTNVQLGRHVHLNPNATIGHDTRIGEFVSVNPGAVVSGDVHIECGTLIGAGATVLQGLSVGSSAVVGAAACVTRDVDANAVVVGVPARTVQVPGE